VSQKTIREGGLGVKLPHHFGLVDCQDSALGHSHSSCHSLRLARKAALPEEMPGIEHGDHRFFSRVRQDRQSHGARLHIHDACGRIALSKDHCGGSVFGTLCSRAGPIEYVDWLGRGDALRFAHRTLPCGGGGR
jgi:hypothetical protein